jgi:hypothetical protein
MSDALPLIDLMLSQLGETATVSVDPEHGTSVVAIDGTVDVNALTSLALDQCAHIIETARRVSTYAPGYETGLPMTRTELIALFKEAAAYARGQ